MTRTNRHKKEILVSTSSHIVFKTYFESANGEHSHQVEHRIHVSRKCSNCAHDGDRDPEWIAEGATAKWGRCMNACSAAEAESEADQWCCAHQTPAEFRADAHRIDRPVWIAVVAE